MSINLAKEFGKWCTGNISDALAALGYQAAIHHKIRPIYTPINIAGRALTIKVERTKREEIRWTLLRLPRKTVSLEML